MDQHKFHGKDIPHIKLDPKMTIEDLVEVFARSGLHNTDYRYKTRYRRIVWRHIVRRKKLGQNSRFK